jgi:8-oxo-dGTP diphosphatase
VGAIVRDAEDRLLVIRRDRPPGVDLWSLPGGRVEPGENDLAAVVREIAEETGLKVRVGPLVGAVERPGPSADVVYAIRDYACTAIGGTLRAGDDAKEARWVTYAELVCLPLVSGLLETLRDWDALPA